jgi:hypothetical protein
MPVRIVRRKSQSVYLAVAVGPKRNEGIKSLTEVFGWMCLPPRNEVSVGGSGPLLGFHQEFQVVGVAKRIRQMDRDTAGSFEEFGGNKGA